MKFNKKKLSAIIGITSMVSTITMITLTVGGFKYINNDSGKYSVLEKAYSKSLGKLNALGNNTNAKSQTNGGIFDDDPFSSFDDITLPPINKPTENPESDNPRLPPIQGQDTPISFNPNRLETNFLNAAMSTSKKRVSEMASHMIENYHGKGTFEIEYLENQNVIVIKAVTLEDSLIYLFTPMIKGEITNDTEFIIYSSDNDNFRHYLSDEDRGFEVVNEYSGFSQIVFDGYPIVFYLDPSLEPVSLNSEEEEEFSPDDGMYEGEVEGSWGDEDINYGGEGEHDYYGNPTEGTGGSNVDSALGDLEWSDPDYGEDIESNYENFWGDSSNNDYDGDFNIEDSGTRPDFGGEGGTTPDWEDEYFQTDGEVTDPNIGTPKPNKYKPVWGTTESSDGMKEQIKDRTHLADKVAYKQNLNVVNVKGESVDLVEKTKNTPPSIYKRVIVEVPEKIEEDLSHIPVVYACAGASLLLMIMSLGSIQIYYKESVKELQLRKATEADTTMVQIDNVMPYEVELNEIL